MTDVLYIGDRAYSSWSLRGWLLFRRFGLQVETRLVDFSAGPVATQIAALAPARSVPVALFDDGSRIADSLAIAEELAQRHPAAGHWPEDPVARATARWLAGEMHAGFTALRAACPMNLRTAYAGFTADAAVRDDIARIESLWSHARETCRPDGPWLCGDYSVADAFYAPVAARIAGYDLPVAAAARDYVAAHLADAAFREWRTQGLREGGELARYRIELPRRDWPGPA